MKYVIIRLISTILFGMAVLNYMAENSSVFEYVKKKIINKNIIPTNKPDVTLKEYHFVPTA